MSNAVMVFQEKAQALGRRLGLDLSGIGAGERAIEIGYGDGSSVSLTCLVEREEISLATELFFVPRGQSEALCRLLLAGHAFGFGTDNACFALDPHSDKFIAVRLLPLRESSAEQLAEALEKLVRLGKTVRDAYARGELAATVTISAAAIVPVQAPVFNFA